MDVNEELKFLCKLKKNKIFFLGGWGWIGGGGGVGLGGFSVDVNGELKFLGKKISGGGVGRGVRWGSGWWGGQGGCERRIEVFVKIQKKKHLGGGVLGSCWGAQGGCE